jgi:hypothetical protein
MVNLSKHRVDFADVVGVFDDPDAQNEQRFVSVGMDFLGRCSRWSTPIGETVSD